MRMILIMGYCFFFLSLLLLVNYVVFPCRAVVSLLLRSPPTLHSLMEQTQQVRSGKIKNFILCHYVVKIVFHGGAVVLSLSCVFVRRVCVAILRVIVPEPICSPGNCWTNVHNRVQYSTLHWVNHGFKMVDPKCQKQSSYIS